MKQKKMHQKSAARRRLMRQIYWHRMLGNFMLRLPWVKRTSPALLRQMRKINACCIRLYRLEDACSLCRAQETAA